MTKLFTFTGEWSPYVDIPAFADFRLTYNRPVPAPAGSPPLIQLQIDDQLTLDPDPSPEQLAAIDYLLQHQHEIADILLSAIYKQYPEFSWWDITIMEGYPRLHSPEALRGMFEIAHIEIKLDQREGLAYVVLVAPCSWFENSGYYMGILLHRDRVLHVCENRDFFKEIEQDGGYYYSSRKLSGEPEKLLSLERFYSYPPHPKYGTLKPWQLRNNYEYPYQLIANRKNEDFIVEVELGLLSVDHVGGEVRDSTEYRGMTFLEYACQCGNEELIRYLLSKKPASVKNCLYHVADNRAMAQLLLDAGADINEIHRNQPYRTAIGNQANTLKQLYGNKPSQENVANAEDMIRWLIAHGADPYVKDDRGYDTFSVVSWFDNGQTTKLAAFLETSFKDFHRRG